MSRRLAERRALITGGDSGIGRAVAVAFAQEGADVAIVFNEDRAAAERTRELVREHDRRCVLIQGDIGKEEDVRRIYQELASGLGGLDVLVNNAGVEQRGEWESFELEDWNRIVRTNLTGTFLMIREALRGNHLQRGGRIITTGSIQGLEGSASDPAYSSTKGGLHAMSKSLSKYLAERGILVNVVAPGPVDTPMLRDQSPEHLEKDGGGKYPLGVATPEQIAPCFVFLASSDGDAFTGQVLTPMGGKVVAG